MWRKLTNSLDQNMCLHIILVIYIFLNSNPELQPQIQEPVFRDILVQIRIRIQLRIRLLSSVTTGTLSSVTKIKFFAKILCSNFILQALFQSTQHIYEKREGSGSVSLTNGYGSYSERPKKHVDPDPVPVPDPQHCRRHLITVPTRSGS
jgi:hypothetical protein